jgi:hypothetical protein
MLGEIDTSLRAADLNVSIFERATQALMSADIQRPLRVLGYQSLTADLEGDTPALDMGDMGDDEMEVDD